MHQKKKPVEQATKTLPENSRTTKQEKAIIAKFTASELDTYRNAFAYFDKLNTGFTCCDSVYKAMLNLGDTAAYEEIMTLMRNVSGEEKGTIDFQDFLRAMTRIHRKKLTSERKLREAFEFFDPELTGFIKEKQLRFALTHFGEIITDEQFEELLPNRLVTYDGNIYYEDIIDRLLKLEKVSQPQPFKGDIRASSETDVSQELESESAQNRIVDNERNVKHVQISTETEKSEEAIESTPEKMHTKKAQYTSERWTEIDQEERELDELNYWNRIFSDMQIPDGVLIKPITTSEFDLMERKEAERQAAALEFSAIPKPPTRRRQKHKAQVFLAPPTVETKVKKLTFKEEIKSK